MKAAKKKVLEHKGYTVSSTDQFLGLSKAESEILEIKLALAKVDSNSATQETDPD